MRQSSRLKAYGLEKHWREGPGPGGPRANFYLAVSREPWATSPEAWDISLEPWAMPHEPVIINNQLINWLLIIQLVVSSK